MSIILYTGRPRQGKTYLLVRDVIKHDLNKGKKVWSNILLDWHGHKNYPASNLQYYTNLKDLYHLKSGVILMDEAHIYMRSRKWESLPEEMERKLAQHGKHRLDIKATVQHPNRLDVIMREIVDYWYVCKKNKFAFVRYEFDIDHDKNKKEILSTRVYPRRKKWYKMYDSYADVVVGEIQQKGEFTIYKDSK